MADAWAQDQENVRGQAGRLTAYLRQELSGIPPTAATFSQNDLDSIVAILETGYDWKNGGWGKAPKFPQPMTIEFLLRQAARGNKKALKMADDALDAMAKGGMYDVVGGGFARYSVDDYWLVPHFEKMLYDNALLAKMYLYGWLLTGKPHYRRIVEETLDFITREMTGPEGGFYASLDADSEGEEGKFYAWTEAEIRTALPDPEYFALVCEAYGIDGKPNFEGKFVLQRKKSDEVLAKKLRLEPEEVVSRLSEAHAGLLKARSARIRPATDDKCVTAWNGLMLAAFSEAAKYLENESYKIMAMRNGKFLLDSALEPGSDRIVRTWRRGQTGPIGFLEDYASTALGLLSLYQVDPNPEWFRAAQDIADHMVRLFYVAGEGFYDTGADHETLLVRPRDLQDNATPSGGSLAAQLLLLMHAFTGERRYRDLAESSLSPISGPGKQYPTAFANWLCAADLAIGPIQEVVLAGEPSAPFKKLLWGAYRPRLVFAAVPEPLTASLPPLAVNRPMVDGKPTAYVCEGFVCLQPVNDPKAFGEQLRA